jgi:hypothetical protein
MGDACRGCDDLRQDCDFDSRARRDCSDAANAANNSDDSNSANGSSDSAGCSQDPSRCASELERDERQISIQQR